MTFPFRSDILLKERATTMRKTVKFSTLPVKTYMVGELPGVFRPENAIECATYGEGTANWIDLGMFDHELYAHIGDDYFPITFLANGKDECILERGVNERKVSEWGE